MRIVKCVFDESINDGSLADVLVADENYLGLLNVPLVGSVTEFFLILFHPRI